MATKGQYSKHPAVYITKEGAPSLLIFNNFFKDYSLPKWQKITETWRQKQKKLSKDPSIDAKDENATLSFREFEAEMRDTIVEERFYIAQGDRVEGRENDKKRDGYYRSLGSSIDRLMAEDLKEASLGWFYGFLRVMFGLKKKDALKTFADVKEAVLKANIPTSKEMENAYKNLVKVIAYLREVGQVDQARDLAKTLDVVAAEITLIKHNYTKFVTQKEILDFMLKSEKGVMIDFIRSYKGIIPPRVYEVKKAADDMMVFDNYVVLYYDPSIAKFKFIREEARETEKRRDPILFGMIQGSDRLYYVTDWTTEEDDLTLDKLETTIGRRAADIRQMKLSGINARHDSLQRTMGEIEASMHF